MTSFGEHACIVGSAAGLEMEDLVYTQYREQGAHIWRGYTLENIINQCIGNVEDGGKGRQMPVHYGSAALNNVTVSSPLSMPNLIKQLKFLRLLAQDMPSEQLNKKRWLLVIWEKVLLVRVIFLLLLTLLPLLNAKLYSFAATINMLFLLQ